MKKLFCLMLVLMMATSAAAFAERYAIIVKSAGDPYYEREAAGFEEACRELGVECIVKAPAKPIAKDQINMILELIDQEVDAIAIAANEPKALQDALTMAMQAGIKVVAVGSATNAASRMTFANQDDIQKIGETLAEAAYDLCQGEGKFAILSATDRPSQNVWVVAMQEALKQEKYAKLNLVKIAYGDHFPGKSASETEGLLQSFPNLECIIAPTLIGIVAASEVIIDKGLSDTVKVSGLGRPSQMAEYIKQGVCPYMYLWNPIDLGYLTGFIADALVKGTITGAVGDQFKAGRLGDYSVTAEGDGTEVLLGPPFAFTPENIDDWSGVY